MNDTTNKPFTFTAKHADLPVTITVEATSEGQARFRLGLLGDVNRYRWDPKDNDFQAAELLCHGENCCITTRHDVDTCPIFASEDEW